jgi:hypothetical protein
MTPEPGNNGTLPTGTLLSVRALYDAFIFGTWLTIIELLYLRWTWFEWVWDKAHSEARDMGPDEFEKPLPKIRLGSIEIVSCHS